MASFSAPHPVFALLDRVWELRENVSAYDASHLTRAELIRCPITVVPAGRTSTRAGQAARPSPIGTSYFLFLARAFSPAGLPVVRAE